MTVPVCVACRHGATRQIAERTAARPHAGTSGVDVEVADSRHGAAIDAWTDRIGVAPWVGH